LHIQFFLGFMRLFLHKNWVCQAGVCFLAFSFLFVKIARNGSKKAMI